MALPPLASADDLAAYLGTTFTGDAVAQAEVVIDHASAAVRVEARTNWVDANGALEDVPVGIPEIVVRVAARIRANPTGAQSQNAGPLAVEYGADPIELTAGEKAAIKAAIRSTFGGLFTIGTTRDDIEMSTVFLDTVPPGDPMPFLADRDII